MANWFARRLFLFIVFGLLLNFLALDFQPQKGAQGFEVWEVKDPATFQTTEPSTRSRELFFAPPKLVESDSEDLTSGSIDRNLAINIGEETYSILGLFIETENKKVTLSDEKKEIIELRINDFLPDGRKIEDISLNTLKLKKKDGSFELIQIYKRR